MTWTILFHFKMLCIACHNPKPASAFYKHPAMASGRLNKCKDCCKKQARQRRRKNAEHHKEIDRTRNARPDRAAARRAYAKTSAGKESLNKSKAKWLAANRFKRAAHVAVGNALRSGKLIKGKCEKCGSLKVQAHHGDYTRPLCVTWLCAKHHREEHTICLKP